MRGLVAVEAELRCKWCDVRDDRGEQGREANLLYTSNKGSYC